jgi:hypothetical protein
VSRRMAEREKPPKPEARGFGRARWVTEPAPDHKLPDGPMDPADAHLLIEQELLLDGRPPRR